MNTKRVITNMEKVFYAYKDFYNERIAGKIQETLEDPKIILKWLNDDRGYFNICLDETKVTVPEEHDLMGLFVDYPILFMYVAKETSKNFFTFNERDTRYLNFKIMQNPKARLRLFTTPFLKIKSHSNNYELMGNKGIVVSVSNPKEEIVVYAFYNEKTGQTIYNTTGVPPGKDFVFVEDDSIKLDRIKVIVQEPIDDLDRLKIRPHTIEMNYYFNGDIHDIDDLQPGQTIWFYTIPITSTIKKKNRIQQVKEYVMVDYEILDKEFDETLLSSKDEKRILEMSKDPNIIDNLVKSFAPHIKGIDKVKEGLLVSFFGGVKDDAVRNRTGNIHVLIVGNPATGKTDLLNHAIKILPKKYYVSGSFSTKAGLVASVKKEDDDFYLQSGALLLANGGFLLIDEFDKFSNKEIYDSLLEAMESGRISFNKATINRIFKVDTTIIAVMNPQTPTETFDETLSIIEQVKLPAPLLSRFALKFAINIERSEENAELIADSMVKTRFEEFKPPYTYDELRKYIVYARSKIKPKITDPKLKEMIKKHIKAMFLSGNVAGIRAMSYFEQIAIAYAKMRLSSEVSKEDLERAFDLVSYAMRSFGVDTEQYFLYTEETRRRNTKERLLNDILRMIPFEDNGYIDEDKLMYNLELKGYNHFDILKAIDYLKTKGEIYERRSGKFVRSKYSVDEIGGE